MEMAHVYGGVYDRIGLFWRHGCLSRRKIIGFFLMEIQTIIAYGIGLTAFIYAIWIFLKQFKTPDVNPKCDDCPVPNSTNPEEN